ncbi:MAG: hypothetical protein P8099_05185 [Gemmatimonadota bacterium]|jgi:uncharacterized protein (DUF1697 family)
MALVALLKGANVGGHRRFRPTVVAEQLQHLDVVNVGATGAFVVRGPVRRTELRAEIANRLPFKAEIIICEGREITRLLSYDFFSDHARRADIVRFAGVMSRAPRSAPELPMNLPSRGKWLLKVLARDGRFVVGLYRREMKVISELSRLDQVFGVSVTTRSWGTLSAVGRVLDGSARR